MSPGKANQNFATIDAIILPSKPYRCRASHLRVNMSRTDGLLARTSRSKYSPRWVPLTLQIFCRLRHAADSANATMTLSSSTAPSASLPRHPNTPPPRTRNLAVQLATQTRKTNQFAHPSAADTLHHSQTPNKASGKAWWVRAALHSNHLSYDCPINHPTEQCTTEPQSFNTHRPVTASETCAPLRTHSYVS